MCIRDRVEKMEEQIKKIYEKQKNGRIRMIRNVPVSYTHLDVYKRQFLQSKWDISQMQMPVVVW